MSEQKLNITWSDFEDNASRSFKKLWHDEQFTDVTLATCDDQQINSHKVILSSCSSFFKNILLKNPHQKPVLYLKDVRHKDLELILQFIYMGECQVDQEDIEEFLAVGKDLKINGLKEQDAEEDTHPNINNIKEEPIDIEEGETINFNKVYNSEGIVFPTPNNNKNAHERFACDQCYYTAPRQSVLRGHKASVHGSPLDSGDSNWEDHELSAVVLPSRDEDGKLPCKKCEYRAPTVSTYKRHVLGVHEGIKRYVQIKKYQCDQCDYKAGRLRMLKAHKVNKHEADKPYPCDLCDYQALSAHILKIHKTSKHDRVRYNCDLCDYWTNWQANLTTHKRKKHIEPAEEQLSLQHEEQLSLQHEEQELNLALLNSVKCEQQEMEEA